MFDLTNGFPSFYSILYLTILVIIVVFITLKLRPQSSVLKSERQKLDREVKRRRETELRVHDLTKKIRDELNRKQEWESNFSYFDVDDQKRQIFIDVFNGFSDFAKLKGYAVRVEFDTRLSNKIGLKVILLDKDVSHLNSERVRVDVDEYLRRASTEDQLADIPMTLDVIEHARIKAALQMRFAALKAQVAIAAAHKTFLEALLKDVIVGQRQGVTVNVTSEGSIAMDKSKHATNSPGTAQGKKARVQISGGQNQILGGVVHNHGYEKSLKELDSAVLNSELPDDVKARVKKSIDAARLDAKENGEKISGEIKNLLRDTSNLLTLAGAAGEVLSKMHEVLRLFGIS